MNKILILEDHYESRIRLTKIIQSSVKGSEITATASLKDARLKLEDESFDLAFLDINLPDGAGFELITELLEDNPACHITMVTIYDNDKLLFEALRLGAKGYLLKDDTERQLSAAVLGILQNILPFSAPTMHHLVEYFHASQTPPHNPLTERETQILTLLSKGYNRAEIARLTGLTKNTASSYFKQIYTKLEVNSRAEATLIAAKLGLVDLPE